MQLQGLIVYRASRLEALLDPLWHLLRTQAPDDPLAPQVVVAAHPGMQQWLAGALARKAGPGGIVANLDIRLPSSWLEACAREVLGESAVALQDWRHERLRWRIHGALDATADPQLATRLAGPGGGLLRFQLAERLARLYTQYMVYRPDWLHAWKHGRAPVPDAGDQPALWRRLQRQVAQPHRGELLATLTERLARGAVAASAEPLHLFGVSHLAPAELHLFAALARCRPVVLYLPDPCREYWGEQDAQAPRLLGLPRSAEARAPLCADAFEDASEARFLDAVGHPLLARWGRMGQHFVLELERTGTAIDLRHWEDEAALAEDRPQPLLARVQASIRQLDAALAARVPAAEPVADASLRVHACHTRLRELEVLRDALLAARAELPGLKPSDIVVMAPDIGAYAPLLGAVFGPAGAPGADLPYHLADVPVARAHPLFTAFAQLLALPQSRLSAPEVLDLLQVPQVAAALGIDASGVDALARWVQRTGVHWGLDGAFRQARFDVPATEQGTFAWGVERMLAGYVFGQDEPGRAIDLPDARLWPVDGIDGPQAALLGALDRLLMQLAAFLRDVATPRRASAWRDRLHVLVDQLFRIDRRDRDASEALALLRGMVEALAAETAEAGDPELGFEVVRELLRERLAAVPERQRLLLGGITFCGMVPQRAIPFRVVAVLGLDDGAFPRQPNDAGLDLTRRPGNRRIGDRDVRNDDRYLFLETLMSARERLHLSYIGEGVQDGRLRNPAAPLADLLAFLDAGTAAAGTPLDCDEERAARAQDHDAPPPAPLRPWHVRHPLQPFDARYFAPGDPRLFSYDQALAGARTGHATAPAFVAGRQPAPARDDGEVLALRSVLAWFKDPARAVLASALQLRLDALDEDALAADEPLDGRLPAIERIPRRLVLDALLQGTRELPDAPPDWLRLGGKLPPGRLGEAVWATAREQATLLLAGVPAALSAAPLQRRPQGVDLVLDGLPRVTGDLRDVLATEDGALWVFDAHARVEDRYEFKYRIPLFLQWALLRLQADDAVEVRACLLLDDADKDATRHYRDALDAWCDAFRSDAAARPALRAALARRARELLALYQRAQRETVWYLPRTSWAACGGDAVAIAEAWKGKGRGKGERDYSPGHAALFARGVEFDGASAEARALRELAVVLERTIRPDLACDAPAEATA